MAFLGLVPNYFRLHEPHSPSHPSDSDMSHPSGVRKESLSSSPVAPFLLSIPPTPLPPHHPSAPGALATPNIRRILAILAVVSALAVLAFPHSSSSFTYGTPPSMDEFIFPRAIYGKNSTLTTYLDERWPVTFGVAAEGESGEGSESPSDASSHPPSYLEPHIWLTMADEAWVGGGTAALGVFVDKLNDDRRRRVGPEARETVLVVLCLDEGCIERCERRGLFCYGGFQYTRPAKVRLSSYNRETRRLPSDVLLHFFAGVDSVRSMIEWILVHGKTC